MMNRLVAAGQVLGGIALWIAALVSAWSALAPRLFSGTGMPAPTTGWAGAIAVVALLAAIGTWLIHAGSRRWRARRGGR